MSPFPGTKVIPDGWEERHRPVVDGTLTLQASLRVPLEGPAPYPEPPGWDGTQELWSGLCRLQELKREGSPNLEGQQVETRGYMAVISYAADLSTLPVGQEGATLHAAGRTYQVQQVMHGSFLWEWDLICQDNLTQNGGSA